MVPRRLDVCKGCGKPKSSETFGSYVARSGPDAGKRVLRGKCNECVATYVRQWNRSRPEKRREQAAADYRRAKQRNPQLNRERDLRRNYGLTFEDYGWILEKQGGGCAVCGDEPADGEWLHVDHSHRSGDIRGLLCGSCNRALGAVDDSIELLTGLRFYLREPPVQIPLPENCRARRLWMKGTDDG